MGYGQAARIVAVRNLMIVNPGYLRLDRQSATRSIVRPPMSFRHYLFPDDAEPWRLSNRLVDGLVAGTDALPQLAGTRQRIAFVWLESDGKTPVRIVRTETSVWAFDREGGIREGLDESFIEVMRSIEPSDHSNQTVVQLAPRLSKKKVEREHRWELTKSEIDRIVRDIWPKSKQDSLKHLKSVSQRKPPLTSEARRAIGEIAEGFWKTSNAIDSLKETSLRGFVFEAQQRSKDDPDYEYLFRAIAEMGERRLEVLRRRRSDKGVWYALVEVTQWSDGIGEILERFHERCASRTDAVAAARSL